ncbi:IS4 family transposase, partial [Scandinavium sp. NPDC088450]
LAGYMAEKKQLHRHYQANSVKHRRWLSYLTLAGELVRTQPGVLRRMNIVNALKLLGKEYSNMVTGE